MPQNTSGYQGSADITAQPRQAFAVTPSDSTDLDNVATSLYVGTEGDLAVVTEGGSQVVYPDIRGWVPVRIKRVLATGTTAAGIIGHY